MPEQVSPGTPGARPRPERTWGLCERPAATGDGPERALSPRRPEGLGQVVGQGGQEGGPHASATPHVRPGAPPSATPGRAGVCSHAGGGVASGAGTRAPGAGLGKLTAPPRGRGGAHSSSYCFRCILWMMSLQSLKTRRMFSVSTAHVKWG